MKSNVKIVPLSRYHCEAPLIHRTHTPSRGPSAGSARKGKQTKLDHHHPKRNKPPSLPPSHNLCTHRIGTGADVVLSR